MYSERRGTMTERKQLGQFGLFIMIAIILWTLVRYGDVEQVNHECESEIELVYVVVESTYIEDEERVEEIIEPVVKEDDLYWLSRIIHAEAKGESAEGRIAVGNVILNRMESDEFPDTVKGVIFQKNQFSPVSNGSIYNEPTEETLKLAQRVLDGERVVPADVLFFYNPAVVSRDSWVWSREIVDSIGNHNFAR
jgi:N-acetylmuramoyl-L-alanine amidase